MIHIIWIIWYESYGLSHTEMLNSVSQNWSRIMKRHLNSLEMIHPVHQKKGRKTVFTWSRAPWLSFSHWLLITVNYCKLQSVIQLIIELDDRYLCEKICTWNLSEFTSLSLFSRWCFSRRFMVFFEWPRLNIMDRLNSEKLQHFHFHPKFYWDGFPDFWPFRQWLFFLKMTIWAWKCWNFSEFSLSDANFKSICISFNSQLNVVLLRWYYLMVFENLVWAFVSKAISGLRWKTSVSHFV